MNSSESQSQPESPKLSDTTSGSEGTPASAAAMDEYYQLKRSIFFVTLAISGAIALMVWYFYSAQTAVSYLIGAGVGIIYLRMLAKSVEKISSANPRTGSGRLALFVGLIVIATQLEQLEVLPAFLGFLTYKLAILVYVLPNSLLLSGRSS
ncbi:ATP synthase subunit I [[Synechococcus] sp. NIES-970]|uniref:ATP synthase subunit I n=1 Tax=Picosynechococcus sp. NKBG15041c TaxID=1407650 RepID=UPI00046799F2|nr:ATP synthase subunit I [Picosynechococcus sp. NKBG15041c]BAW95815.1 ATP synthase subunit I [[Synechococcus] sp. NIES-970]